MRRDINMKGSGRLIESLVALAVYGGSLTGVVGFAFAIIILINDEPISAALSLMVAGISFGLLANALIRD
jgi:hypothetical protein